MAAKVIAAYMSFKAPILESILLKHTSQRLLSSEAGEWVCTSQWMLQANKYSFH